MLYFIYCITLLPIVDITKKAILDEGWGIFPRISRHYFFFLISVLKSHDCHAANIEESGGPGWLPFLRTDKIDRYYFIYRCTNTSVCSIPYTYLDPQG
jgi:hypothetical protein